MTIVSVTPLAPQQPSDHSPIIRTRHTVQEEIGRVVQVKDGLGQKKAASYAVRHHWIGRVDALEELLDPHHEVRDVEEDERGRDREEHDGELEADPVLWSVSCRLHTG